LFLFFFSGEFGLVRDGEPHQRIEAVQIELFADVSAMMFRLSGY
jgi:hypothetical protein